MTGLIQKNIIPVMMFFFCCIFFFGHVTVAESATWRKDIVKKINTGASYLGDRYRTMRLAGVKMLPNMEQRAVNKLKWLILGKNIRFYFDRIKYDQSGNALVYLYCPTTGFSFDSNTKYYKKIFIKDQGVFLNAYLISQGFAAPDENSCRDPEMLALFESLYDEAKKNKVGAWKYYNRGGKRTKSP